MFQPLSYPVQETKASLVYSCTNEPLEAVVKGMALTAEDVVLTIGGSGDQAFAMLEYAREVIVVDQNPAQIEFIRMRADGLRRNDLTKFYQQGAFGEADFYLGGSHSSIIAAQRKQSAQQYFQSSNERVERIREKLGNLKVWDAADIFFVAGQTKFSKVYLSNILDGCESYTDCKELVAHLAPDGLMAVVGSASRIWIQQFSEKKLQLKLEQSLSHRDSPFWTVSTFRKLSSK